MAIEIAIEVASKVVDLLIVPVGRQIDYAWNCVDHINNLRGEVKTLKESKDRVQHSVKEAKKRREKILSDVEEWLNDTNQFIERVDDFLQAEDSVNKKCYGVLCPDCKTKYQRGRKAKKEKLKEVAELCKRKDEFDGFSYLEAPQSLWPMKGYETFDSRISTLKDVMQALADPSVNKIGLYGIDGVGKTTLAREIARQAKEENLFDEVVIATVFQDQSTKQMQGEIAVMRQTPDVGRIQKEIAEGLGLPFQFDTDRGRAAELRGRLKDESGKLLVLDNIWAGLELEDLGIPNDHKECKILMTSTNQKVLSSQMGTQKNFLLDSLFFSEAWEWFKKIVGDVFKVPGLEEVAAQVADRCAGLPILLIPVAKGLKENIDLDAWKEALKQLSCFDKDEMHTHVDSTLQLSYSLLGGDEIKSLLLLCGQLNPIPIRHLLKYAFGLGLFKQCNTLEKGRSRLLKLVNDLKDSCLLLEGNSPQEVEMHDIVGSFAVSIASRDHNAFIVAHDTPSPEWPAEDVLENLTTVSLISCKIPDLPEVFQCPKLESFILSSNDPSLKVPDKFFERTRKIKVLDLTEINFSQLPPSLKNLENLRTFCLDSCVLKDISIIGKLKKLQVLSLSGSDIIRLPKEIRHLSCLRLLDLSHCKRLEVIPPNVLSSLVQLEELCMENTCLQWEFEGMNTKRTNASLAELKHLSNLNTLDIHITDAKMLPKGLFSESLERFRIFIGDGWNWSGKYKTSRTLKIKLNTSIQWEKGLKGLLKRTEDLYLDELKGLRDSVYELDVLGFRQLKHLHVENSSDIQFIVNSTGMGPSAAFTRLESLSLNNLQNLKKISDGQLTPESFSNLRNLKVESCDALENFVSSSMARGLSRLEEIKIADCKSLNEVFSGECKDDIADNDKPIELPQLRKLVLDTLPQFSRFFSKMKAPSKSQMRQNISDTNMRLGEIVHEIEMETSMPVFNERILFPNLKELKLSSINIDKIWDEQILELSSCIQNLTSLIVDGCNNLKYLFSSFVVENLVNLKTLEVTNCRMMEQIIITEGFGEGMSKVKFCQLGMLQLENLPELTQVSRSNLFECPALKELLIENCPKLRMFISKSGKENLAVSNEAEPTNFSLFDEKVAFPNLEALGIFNMNNVKMIWHNELRDNSFSKLKRLSITNVEEVVKIFPANHVLSRFKNVEALYIAGCNSLEEIYGSEATTNTTPLRVATKLKTLELRFLKILKNIWNKDTIEILSFLNLQKVNVSDCPNLKSVFPASVARNLLQLTYVNITDCGVEEIVSKEEGKELIADFDFPRLTHLELWRLPELKRFYSGRHTSEFPKLKNLRVYGCEKIGMFTSESQHFEEQCSEDQIENSPQQPLFSAEKVIPNLEELPLNSNDARMLWEGQFPSDLLCNVKVLFLQCFHDESSAFPLSLIQRFNNLEELDVGDSCFKEIFANDGFANLENPGKKLEKLRALRLDFLYNVKQIKLDHFLKNLESLEVWSCHSLTNLAPPSASFQNLKVLVVQYCDKLVSLITSSTAESLVQLTELSVANCKVLIEILANGGDDGKVEITFRKLETLRLDCLTSFRNFCSAICTLTFPSLEEVILKQCTRMTVFSQGGLHTPKLRRVQTEGRDKIRWMGDLNATVQQLYTELTGFDGLQQMKLSEFPELEGRWPDQLPVKFFDELNSLVVDDCGSCSIAVPSNLLPSLDVLEELEVRNCNSVEEVFDVGQPNAPGSTEHLSKLTKFQLVDLPKLKHVWTENAKGVLDFRKLKQLKIQNCGSLRYIFTPPMLLCLNQLQEIEVKICPAIEEIVAKGEAEEATTYKITTPMLNSITLEGLPKLVSFYSGSGIVEFPSLKMVAVVDCSKTFTSQFLRGHEQSTSHETTEAKVIFPSLEKLRVAWNDDMNDFIGANSFCKLKVFELIRFPGDLATFPSHVLRRLPSLENLVLSDAAFEDIALYEETKSEENHFGIPTQVKELNLSKFPKLTLLSKYSQSRIVLQNLKSLRVSECVNLKLLLPLSVSFEHLTVLEVSKCHGLKILIFSSTAESLVQLTTLSVSECEMMIEVISEEQNVAGNGFIFRKLKCLRLQCLPSLTNFYSGKYALVFPTLEEVYLSECPKIEAFSQGDVKMPKLKNLQLPDGEGKENWEGSHYTYLQQLFLKMKQAAAKTRSTSLPRQQNLDFETTHTTEVHEIVVSEEIASEDLHTSKIPNSSKDPPAECAKTNEVASKEETMKNSTRESEIIDLASDSPATSNNKKDSEEGEGTPCNSIKNDSRPSSRNLSDGEATNKNKPSDVSHSHTNGFEQPVVSATNTISSQELTDVAASKPTSDAPSFQIVERSTHSAAHFEHIFSSIGQVLRPTSSSKPQTSSITYSDLSESTGISLEHTYGDHVSLLKKILRKPLSEVSRSQDVLLLLSTLENLKSCHHLNSQQSEAIQYYIEHFDTLVTYHPFYEDQIGRASELQLSVRDDMKGIPELKTLCNNLANKADGLSAEKEALKKKLQALKKKLQEVEEEVRAEMEGLYGELVTKDVKLNALPKAEMLLKETEDKARSARDHWTKIRDLFA